MKLVIFLLCIFTVCFGATSRLKATQVIVSEEQIIQEIPGGSYELNTVAAEEEPLGATAAEPAAESAAAGPIEIEPVYVEAQAQEPVAEPIAVTEPVYETVATNEEYQVIITDPQPAYTSAPIANEEILLMIPETVVHVDPIVSEEVTIVEEPVVYSTVEEIPDQEVYYTTTGYEPEVIEEPIVTYEEPEPISGGYTDIPLSRFDEDQELKSAAQVCITALLDAAVKDGKLGSENGWTLSSVNRIRSQVVAGTNYEFDVILGNENDAAARIFATFTAFSQPWTETLTCTDGCVKIGRMVRV